MKSWACSCSCTLDLRITMSRYLTTSEAAAELGVSRIAVANWCRDGWRGFKLPCRQVGRVYAIRREDLERFQALRAGGRQLADV
jgi:excisionase family DNA binding protein